MGIFDTFKEEDRVTVTVSQLYKTLREAAKAELLMNAVRCDVPNRYIAVMADGKYPEIIHGELPEVHTEDLPITIIVDEEQESVKEEGDAE